MLDNIQTYERLTMTTSSPLTTTSNTYTARRRASGLLWGGLALILSGAGLLLTAGQLRADNWWAVFILLAALGSLGGAALALHDSRGLFNLWVWLHLASGLVVLTVALIFLYHIDWSLGWTLMLIVTGLTLLVNGFGPGRPLGSLRRSTGDLLAWCGASTAALGVTFLLDRLGVFSLVGLFGTARWWSAFILLPGLGMLLNALGVRLWHGQAGGARLLAGAGLALVVCAVGEYLGLPTRWTAPVLLMLVGLALLWPAGAGEAQ